MTEPDPLEDEVARQYGRWVYPGPITDLPTWLATHWEWFDPSISAQLLWPDRDYRPDLDILIAGCGANQAATFAYTNPRARVVGIDVSEASLAHERVLQQQYELANLELHRAPIEGVASLGRDFDLIVATGTLHHLADPAVGLRALAACLRPEGVIGVMLYARYGRHGVELAQSMFRDLGLQQDEESLEVVRAALEALPPTHPLAEYRAIAPDLGYDAGLVDTFLHQRDRSYTVPDCLDLVASAGLEFQDWLLKSSYYPPVSATDPSTPVCASCRCRGSGR